MAFSCDVHDSQKDFFQGKQPQNLDFKKQKWKVMLNISNAIPRRKRTKRVKCNIFM